jgi:hypothetical protein
MSHLTECKTVDSVSAKKMFVKAMLSESKSQGIHCPTLMKTSASGVLARSQTKVPRRSNDGCDNAVTSSTRSKPLMRLHDLSFPLPRLKSGAVSNSVSPTLHHSIHPSRTSNLQPHTSNRSNNNSNLLLPHRRSSSRLHFLHPRLQ